MERNYDELFAEMLMQIDRHTEALDKHSLELTKQSAELTKQSAESTRRWDEQHQINLTLFTKMEEVSTNISTKMEEISNNMKEISTKLEGMESISNQHLDQLVLSATILDRIIKNNHLKL